MAYTDFIAKFGEDYNFTLQDFVLKGSTVTDLSGYRFVFVMKKYITDTTANAKIKIDSVNNAADFVRDNVLGKLQIHAIKHAEYASASISPETYYYEVRAYDPVQGESYLCSEGRICVNDGVLDVFTIT